MQNLGKITGSEFQGSPYFLPSYSILEIKGQNTAAFYSTSSSPAMNAR